MRVWIDCHGSPGSQNGFDNSGRQGNVLWQQPANLARYIAVLETMPRKYGALEYADVVVGLELVNEPISWGNNQFSVTQTWAREAYAAVKAIFKNEDLVVVMHGAFMDVCSWTGIAGSLNQAQHIAEACSWSSSLSAANAIAPTYVGEWSTATNICVNPDGTTTAGTSCSVPSCQCQSVPFNTWNAGMIEQVRM